MNPEPTTPAITDAAWQVARSLVSPALYEQGVRSIRNQLIGASHYAAFQPNADYTFLHAWASALDTLPASGPDREARLTDLIRRAANGQHPTGPV